MGSRGTDPLQLMFVRFPSPVDINKNVKVKGWVYVGSANASESAW